jgi:CheY-like chemotaxis protein
MSTVPNLSGITLLVVDDDLDTRELYQLVLAWSGASVMTAESGNTGWHRFRDHRPHLLISDVHMPDGDGYDLVRRIRALPAEDGGLLPAIATSGAASPEQSLEAGFHAHLDKPPCMTGLVDLVSSFVREGSSSRATWTLTESLPNIALLTFVGHVTADDMRGATVALAMLLETAARHVVVDLRELDGFDLSVGSVAERTTWRMRRRIAGATIVGGSWLARLVAKAACVTLGTSCAFVDDWPPQS